MRITREEYFGTMAQTVSMRSTCPRAKVGAILVSDNVVLGTGYNGAPKGWAHCIDIGCMLVNGSDGKERCVRIVHAEINALIRASTSIAIEKDLFVTHKPCFNCYLALCNSNIAHIFYLNDFIDPTRDDLIPLNRTIFRPELIQL